MATPPKPWKAEYAKSGRSSCKTCKSPIDKDKLRLGKMVVATQFDGFMPMWNHAGCILKKAKQIKSFDDVEGVDLLRWEDQEKIRKYVEGGSVNTSSTVDSDCAIEVSLTSRATCRRCNEKIMKGTVRVSTKPEGQGARGVAWHHIHCFIQMSPSINIEKVSGWDIIPPEEKATVSSLVKKGKSTTKTESSVKEDKVAASEQTSKGTKRKKDGNTEQKAKIPKSEGSAAGGGSNNDGVADLESKLKEQTNSLWDIKDGLKKHVSTSELREMLEANGQDSGGSENDLRERCADGMLFGALGKCPICSGSLHYSEGRYCCHGYVSAWSKCSYSTTEPVRLKQKWKIPKGINNEYLLKWSKSQKANKPDRILPPVSSKSLATQKSPVNSQSERLEDLKIAIAGELKGTMEDWKKKLVEAGGKVHAKITKDTSCLVLSGEVHDSDSAIRKARRMKIPIVRDEYLGGCIKKQKKLPFDLYKVEAASETSKSGMLTVKVKGRSAVHEASGLQETGHILEDRKSIYNTTLNMSDLVTGVNSYYILQIIQEDKGSDCYVFRKWGRVGSEKIGGSKLEEMSKDDAIIEFKRLFLEKTGNPWEAWEQKQNFEKYPGRFFPLDIDYGVKQVSKKKDPSNTKSLLAPQLVELMKMLFNVETYRAAMLEFEINMSEMPLGKLSKRNIQKGFEVLTEIQNMLNNSSNSDPAVRESLIVDASNRFFTLIPSIHPHVIRDEDDFNAKDWSLELEEVFALEREGEFDKYAPYRDKLKNKMLLWHGSRLTNFVGILSQGLRIAPPEAPATGYMFGKGVYFADLVSKSAQYCYVDRKDPVGLMLLSEVALGEIYELKKATYVDKLPRGKHSTKGLGKTVPLESEFAKWRDVVVPCGKPVPSSVRASELLYNEYIVYNTAQVKMQFLLKVRFIHKR